MILKNKKRISECKGKGGKAPISEGRMVKANGKTYQILKESQSNSEMEEMIIGLADQVMNMVAGAEVNLQDGNFALNTRIRPDKNIFNLAYDMDMLDEEVQVGDGDGWAITFIIGSDDTVEITDESVEGLYVVSKTAANGRCNISGQVDIKSKMPKYTVADLLKM